MAEVKGSGHSGALGATCGGAWRGACLGSPAPGPAESKRRAQRSPSPSTRPAPLASAGSADYLSAELHAPPCCPQPPRSALSARLSVLRACTRCSAPALGAPRLHSVLRACTRCSAPRVRPVVMAGLVVSGTQVSYIGQDCREIPEHLGRDCGHFAKRLDLSFNLLRVLSLFLVDEEREHGEDIPNSELLPSPGLYNLTSFHISLVRMSYMAPLS
nr:leucine-rich melanocyte differentiation-associated protein isoform X4 [Mirounga angustirostris]